MQRPFLGCISFWPYYTFEGGDLSAVRVQYDYLGLWPY